MRSEDIRSMYYAVLAFRGRSQGVYLAYTYMAEMVSQDALRECDPHGAVACRRSDDIYHIAACGREYVVNAAYSVL